MDGAHRFVERQIAEPQERGGRFWKYDRSSAAAWEAALKDNRDRLRDIIGAVDPRSLQPWNVLATMTIRPWWQRQSLPRLPGSVAGPRRHDGRRAARDPSSGTASAHSWSCRMPSRRPSRSLASHLAWRQNASSRASSRRAAASWSFRAGPAPVDRDRPTRASPEPADLARVALPAGLSHGPASHRLRGPKGAGRGRSLPRAARRSGEDRRRRLRRRRSARLLCRGHRSAHRRRARERLFRSPRASLGTADRSQHLEPARAVRRRGDRLTRPAAPPRHRACGHSVVQEHEGHVADAAGASVRAEFNRIPAGTGFPRPSLVAGDGDQPSAPYRPEALGDFAKRLGFALATRPPVATRRPAQLRSGRAARAHRSRYGAARPGAGTKRRTCSRSRVSLHRAARTDGPEVEH